MTKHHFETKVKGRVDLRSTNYRNYPKSQNQKLRALRNQTSTILEESDQETIRRVESLTSKASENAKNAKNMKIFFKNYTSFIKGVSDSQQIERRMRTYGKTRRQSMDSDRSFISKEKIQTENDELRTEQMNRNFRQRNMAVTIQNRPIDANFTYKNLKKFQKSLQPKKNRLRDIHEASVGRIRHRNVRKGSTSLDNRKKRRYSI